MIQVAENLVEKYKPRFVSFVKLTNKAREDYFMQELMPSLEKKAPKQLDLLLGYLRLQHDQGKDAIQKSFLLRMMKSSPTILQSLVKKEVFEVFEESVDRQSLMEVGESQLPFVLSPDQQQAFIEVKDAFNDDKVVLLHGVTSSGKTEIYIHLLQEELLKLVVS